MLKWISSLLHKKTIWYFVAQTSVKDTGQQITITRICEICGNEVTFEDLQKVRRNMSEYAQSALSIQKVSDPMITFFHKLGNRIRSEQVVAI